MLAETAIGDVVQYEVPIVVRSDGGVAAAFIVAASGGSGTDLVFYQFLPGGGTDPNFGVGGSIAIKGVGNALDMSTDDLKRLVLLSGTCQILRRLAGGAADLSFGADGASVISVGDACAGGRVEIQRDRRILIGATRTTGGSDAVVLARLWH